jgi:hypothetical protein
MQRAKKMALTMKNLLDLIKTLGEHCSDLVGNVEEIVTILNTGTLLNTDTIQNLKESVRKLNESIAKVKETSKEINEALNKLKSLIGNEDEDGEADSKSKTGRVIAKVANLIEDITNILEQCLEVALQVDLIVKKGGQGNLSEQKDTIVESFREIKNRAIHIKDTLKDIINIIRGKGNESDREMKDQEEGAGCWARFKSALCCCCCNKSSNPKTVESVPEPPLASPSPYSPKRTKGLQNTVRDDNSMPLSHKGIDSPKRKEGLQNAIRADNAMPSSQRGIDGCACGRVCKIY